MNIVVGEFLFVLEVLYDFIFFNDYSEKYENFVYLF